MVDGGVDGFCLDITERRLQPERRPTLVVNVVGTFTTEPLQASLKTWCAAATGARVRVKHCGYDTVMKELLSPDATFASAPPIPSATSFTPEKWMRFVCSRVMAPASKCRTCLREG